MALSIFTVIYTHKSTRLRSTGDSRSKYQKSMGWSFSLHGNAQGRAARYSRILPILCAQEGNFAPPRID